MVVRWGREAGEGIRGHERGRRRRGQGKAEGMGTGQKAVGRRQMANAVPRVLGISGKQAVRLIN